MLPKKKEAVILSTLILGIIIGALITVNLDSVSHRLGGGEIVSGCYAAESSESAFPAGNTFADVAEQVMPTIVTVYSEQVIRVRRPNYWFGPNDDFFQRFFGWPDMPGRSQQQPQYDEYHKEGLGSGVVVSSDGHILTNNHVVINADDIRIKAGEKTYEAKIVGSDEKTDLAVLKIEPEEPLKAATLGNSDDIRVGQWVLAIGHPFNLDHTVTAGIISAKGRNRMGIADYEDFLQTDAAINPGNSGGALVNLKGELIGINTAIASRNGQYSGVGFAIPINMVKNVMNQLIDFGKVVRGYIGIGIQDINSDLAKAFELDEAEGVLITQIMPETPAEKAGLRTGDVIIKMNGENIESASQFRNAIASTAPGTEIELTVIRDGKKKRVDLTLTELPSAEKTEPIAEKTSETIELGIKLEPANEEALAQYGYKKGLVVIAVQQGSPAAEVGIMPNDLLFEVNRQPVGSLDDYYKQLSKAKKDKPILLLIGRNGGMMYIAITLEEG